MKSALLSLFIAFVLSVTTSLAQPSAISAREDSGGNYHITAHYTDDTINIDGNLNEAAWTLAERHTGFTQAEPHEGEAASERTEVRIIYNKHALYVSAICYDQEPHRLVVNDIRKDFTTADSDVFAFVIDGFLDRKNGFIFITNPKGARFDQQVANEGRDLNPNWDGVWSVATQTTDEGWIAEFEVPLKTLRFATAESPIWGINFARRIRRKNELDFWYPVPRRWNLYRTAFAGTLGGLSQVQQGRNLKVKPFGLTSSTRTQSASSYEKTLTGGLDIKYGVTTGLTLDITANTDFSQVESDFQQVNLTRFSLFFPEKREFFLENSGIFQFGEVPRNIRGTSAFRPPNEEILLFFSRRIGLSDEGKKIPMAGGARLTGKAGPYTIGIMNLQTRHTSFEALDGTTVEEPASNFFVTRIKRDILSNSDFGAILINKQATNKADVFNRVIGADSNFRFREVWMVNGFISRSFSPNLESQQRDETSGKISVGYESNFLHYGYSYLDIGNDFTNEVGFIKRRGVRKQFVDFGIRPRPGSHRSISRTLREVHPHFRMNYFTNQKNRIITKENHFGVSLELQNSSRGELAWNPNFEHLDLPFTIRQNVTIPAGDYQFGHWSLRFDSDRSRMIAGAFRAEWGDFWTGKRFTLRSTVSLSPNHQTAFQLNFEHNEVKLEGHQFTTDLVSLLGAYSFTTNMFLNALVQYNTDLDQVSSNIRFNLIHRPLSDLFIVYDEERPTITSTLRTGRALTVKFTQLLSF